MAGKPSTLIQARNLDFALRLLAGQTLREIAESAGLTKQAVSLAVLRADMPADIRAKLSDRPRNLSEYAASKRQEQALERQRKAEETMSMQRVNRRLAEQGLRWCGIGKHTMPVGEFGSNQRRCYECCAAQAKAIRIARGDAGKCEHCGKHPHGESKEKRHMYNVLNGAVKRGKIRKPSTCSKCGRGGRICGWHRDHTKPLKVVWLCSRCMGKERAK